VSLRSRIPEVQDYFARFIERRLPPAFCVLAPLSVARRTHFGGFCSGVRYDRCSNNDGWREAPQTIKRLR
jgi:hypothetical protein